MDETEITRTNEGEQSAGANCRGCSVGYAFRNFNPPSRLHSHPAPAIGTDETLGVATRVL